MVVLSSKATQGLTTLSRWATGPGVRIRRGSHHVSAVHTRVGGTSSVVAMMLTMGSIATSWGGAILRGRGHLRMLLLWARR